MKYIFVTGGVISGVGKGVTAASIGAALKSRGARVSMQKLDPYFNVDAGLLNPAEHGECFVTRDGAETDLDLGSYERFLDEEMTNDSIATSGKLFAKLLKKERAGEFHGKSVQLVPHFTNLIREEIIHSAKSAEKNWSGKIENHVHIVEIGGTVGDLEGAHFIEAIRAMPRAVGAENCFFIHVVFVPFLHTSHELKTKPAQNALRDLREFGIVPNMVAVRVDVGTSEVSRAAADEISAKIATFSGVEQENVAILPNSASVYDIPLTTEKSGAIQPVAEFLGAEIAKNPAKMEKWQELSRVVHGSLSPKIRVALVAKYVANTDTYISVSEALKSAGFAAKSAVEIVWVSAEKVEKMSEIELAVTFAGVDGIVVPGGFGARGVEGKIRAADFAFRKKIPFLGLCLGLQVAVIAAARRGGIVRANSEEFAPKIRENVIYIMSEQRGKESTGGTMRLGNYDARLKKNSRAAKIYQEFSDVAPQKSGEIVVTERHRHRYEVNQKFLPEIARGGLEISGTSPDGKLVEFVEANSENFYVATQAHPEFRSRPTRAHPLFRAFILAAKSRREKREKTA